jgi:hypothetical protein
LVTSEIIGLGSGDTEMKVLLSKGSNVLYKKSSMTLKVSASPVYSCDGNTSQPPLFALVSEIFSEEFPESQTPSGFVLDSVHQRKR